MKFFESRLVYFENAGKPELSSESLAGLKDKKEEQETDGLDVDRLVSDSNKIIDSHADKIAELPPQFSKALHDNIVQYFMTSADRYDKDAERGLDAIEFGKYSQDMLSKLVSILDAYAPAMEKQNQAVAEASEAVEAVSQVEIKDFTFNSANLATPEGIQEELLKYDKQGGDFRERISGISGSIGDFQASCQKFEEGKKQWSVFMRGNGFFGLNIGFPDNETQALNSTLNSLKKIIGDVLPGLQDKQKKLADYGADMNRAGDNLREQALIDRENDLAEIDSDEDSAEVAQKANERQYAELEERQQQLSLQKNELDQYSTGLMMRYQDAIEAEENVSVQAEELAQFDASIDTAIAAIDGALDNGNLTEEKAKELQTKKEKLLASKAVVSSGVSGADDALEEIEAGKAELSSGADEARAISVNLGEYLLNNVLPASEAIDSAMKSIELAKMKNGTQREQIEATYIEKLEAIDNVDLAVADTVLQNSLANQKMMDTLIQQKNFLDTVDIERPGIWDATGGLLLEKVGQGWGMMSTELLDPLGGWVKDITKDIPVVNVFGEVLANVPIGLVSGVAEGVSELTSGINMIISHPLDTLNGLGGLIGRNPANGDWSFGTAGTTWRELWGVLIAYDEFAEGNIGKGLGKVALNVLLTATGGGAALKGAQGAVMIYSAARLAGAGVARAGLRAAGTGARVFAVEFSSGVAGLPRWVGSGLGRLATSPVRIARWFKETHGLSEMAKLERATALVSKKASEASAALEGVTIGGRRVSEIEGLAGKTFEQVKAMSFRELAACGIVDAKSVMEFMKYKSALKAAAEAEKSLALAVARQTKAEFEAEAKVAAERLQAIQAKLKTLEEKLKSASPDDVAVIQSQIAVAQTELKMAKAWYLITKMRTGAMEGLGFENYVGIRDLGKTAGLTMEEQYQLAKRFIESSGRTIDDMIRMDDTVGVFRPVEIVGTVDDVARGAEGVEKVLGRLREARSLADMDVIIATVVSPAERQILEALAGDLKAMGPTALEEVEKVTILKESLRYLSDYKAALREGPMGSVKSSQDIFDLIRNNQRKLAHQTIVDRSYFTGSDHGVTHILDANMAMADKIFADMGGKISARQRVLIRQAILDHDMGYTINTLADADTGKYFAMTKDHPLYSTAWVETNKAEYVKYFGEEGYEIIRNAILDHSNAAKLDLTATGGALVENIVAGVDCLGTTADIKMMKLFRDPEMMAELLQLKELADQMKVVTDPLERAKIVARVDDVKASMVRYIKNGPFDEPLKKSYLRALERNFDPRSPDFAFSRDFGSHSAGFEGISVADDGAVTVNMSVNQNFSLVREMFGQGDAVSTSALAKAMDDYGLTIKPGKPTKATVIRDGVEMTVDYSQADFAADLAKVESGEMATLVVKTPRATFNFVKNAEKGRELTAVLRREKVFRDTIRELDNPDVPLTRAQQVLQDLAEQFVWDGYFLDGQSAVDVLTNVRELMIEGRKAEAVDLLRDLRFKGTKLG